MIDRPASRSRVWSIISLFVNKSEWIYIYIWLCVYMSVSMYHCINVWPVARARARLPPILYLQCRRIKEKRLFCRKRRNIWKNPSCALIFLRSIIENQCLSLSLSLKSEFTKSRFWWQISYLLAYLKFRHSSMKFIFLNSSFWQIGP